jgi:hypothetical protein
MTMALVIGAVLIGGFAFTMSRLVYDEWRVKRELKRGR